MYQTLRCQADTAHLGLRMTSASIAIFRGQYLMRVFLGGAFMALVFPVSSIIFSSSICADLRW